MICGAAEFAVIHPSFMILFSAELKRSVLESAISKGLFRRGQYTRLEQQDEPPTPSESTVGRLWTALGVLHQSLRQRLMFLRLGMFKELPVLEGRARA
jgi:hypothetical protein